MNHLDVIGGLSKPSKMPCYGYSTPASLCVLGSKLRDVPGSTCSFCYARKGRYVFPNVQTALNRRADTVRLALSDSDYRAQWVAAFAALLDGEDFFRWHDSGDIWSVEHLRIIVEVCEATPKVSHWLPTREYHIVQQYLATFGAFPSNLTVRLSAHMVNGKAPAIGLPTSGVHTEQTDGFACDAKSRGGMCGKCRACWDSTVTHVSYPKH